MSNVSFITGRESVMVNTKKAVNAVSDTIKYFSQCTPIGKPKNIENVAKKEMTLAEKSYVKSHSGINFAMTDSAKSGSTVEYFG